MKTIRIIAPLLALVLAGLTACRTTEANYRAAYEKALARQNEGLTDEELAGFEREKRPAATVWRGDTIPLVARYARTVTDKGADSPAGRYNIVVAEFSQQFNAMSAAERSRGAGYPEARVLFDNNKRYYVSAASVGTLDSALVLLRAVDARPPFELRSPAPYILEKLGSR